ncbi:YncE family protein [Novosphingobium sp.]|uniref:YncE family protein n=1 Tax=Novosphingobium sp. TaxID=1874826 RepID=UPI003BAC294B
MSPVVLVSLVICASTAVAETPREGLRAAAKAEGDADDGAPAPRSYDNRACGTIKGGGPLTCEAAYLGRLPPTSYTRTPPLLSPDGRSIAAYDGIEGLSLARLVDRASVQVASRYGIAAIGFLDNASTLAWLENSRELLSVRQKTDSHGFATSPLEPVRYRLDGKARSLPTLVHAAGPLDGIAWVGHAGMAIAEFGTKGEYYRPPREDPAPTLAIVDAIHGRVLQAIPFPPKDERGFLQRVMKLVVRQTTDGDVHAVLRLGNIGWFEWKQGQPLRPIALGGEPDVVAEAAIMPDGSALLIARALSANGPICEHNPECPPPAPQTGVVAELKSLSTGAVQWRITGTATAFSNPDPPAISPDGRYALITLPRLAGSGGANTALISMEDGRILQTIRNPWSSACAMGFTPDGRRAWVSGDGNIYVLRLKS